MSSSPDLAAPKILSRQGKVRLRKARMYARQFQEAVAAAKEEGQATIETLTTENSLLREKIKKMDVTDLGENNVFALEEKLKELKDLIADKDGTIENLHEQLAQQRERVWRCKDEGAATKAELEQKLKNYIAERKEENTFKDARIDNLHKQLSKQRERLWRSQDEAAATPKADGRTKEGETKRTHNKHTTSNNKHNTQGHKHTYGSTHKRR